MKWKDGIIAAIAILLLVSLHLPFLHADPDYFLSIGRDAFTDEGLNTSQLRNYINHGYLSFDECDNLIKTPLFNLILFLPLKYFGTHLVVARLTILFSLLIVSVILLTNSYFRKLLPFLFITTLTQYYVFQYSHFSLSEMLSVSCIIAGILFLFRFLIERNSVQLFLASLLLSAAYYSKLQFAYIIFLLPASLIAAHVLKISYSSARVIAMSILWLTIFSFIYFMNWYFPHHAVFDFVMRDESSQKFASVSDALRTFAFNVVYVLFSPQNWWFNTLTAICLVFGVIIYRKSDNVSFKILFVISALWLMIELHKLTMIYLPSRYLVSYYFAAGLMNSAVLTEAIRRESGKIITSVSLLLSFLFIAVNGYSYTEIFQRRTFQVEAINRYFSSTITDPSKPVLGVWSTNATWDCKARCIPVWNNFMNDKDVFMHFHPQAILSELNEDESNQAFSSKGIDLKTMADSSRSFQIGKWEVNIYWIRQ